MRYRAWLWRHPELSVLTPAALAWVLLLAPTNLGMSAMKMSQPQPSSFIRLSDAIRRPALECLMSMSANTANSGSAAIPGMSRTMPVSGTSAPTVATGQQQSRSDVHMVWTFPILGLMVLAMMLPSTTGSVRQVASRSLWCRRRRATVEWIVGYCSIWLAVSAAILGLRAAAIAVGVLKPGPAAMAIGLVVAAAWQLTPLKRAALNGCHRTRPLTPRGRRADWDCYFWGILVGRECVVSCGPLMAAMTFGVSDSLTVMVGLTVVILAERFRHKTPRRATALIVALLAAVAA
jgi:predicted metal-binding membrane protein